MMLEWNHPRVQRLALVCKNALRAGRRQEKQRLQETETEVYRQLISKADPELAHYFEKMTKDELQQDLADGTIAFAVASAVHIALQEFRP